MTDWMDFKVTIFFNINADISKIEQDRDILSMAYEYEVVHDLSNDAIFNDLERPLNQI